jgi:hypothetical protein
MEGTRKVAIQADIEAGAKKLHQKRSIVPWDREHAIKYLCVSDAKAVLEAVEENRNMEAIPRKFSPEELVQLTAAERRQLGSEFDARKAVAEIQLRQWCVEQARQSNGQWVGVDPPSLVTNSVVLVAQNILDFVTAPLKPEAPK